MEVFGAGRVEMARVLGVSEARLTQLMAGEEYKAIVSQIALEKMEEDELVNDAWDVTEARALEIVIANLEYNKDPDFALKAANVANRAQRRGQAVSREIVPAHGIRAVISLSQHFIQKLEVIDAGVAEVTAPEKKKVNMLSVDKVEALLDGRSRAREPRDSGNSLDSLNWDEDELERAFA